MKNGNSEAKTDKKKNIIITVMTTDIKLLILFKMTKKKINILKGNLMKKIIWMKKIFLQRIII